MSEKKGLYVLLNKEADRALLHLPPEVLSK